jgi:hypothetical protein
MVTRRWHGSEAVLADLLKAGAAHAVLLAMYSLNRSFELGEFVAIGIDESAVAV